MMTLEERIKGFEPTVTKSAHISANIGYDTFDKPMPCLSNILICGHDASLLNTRRWVLEKAGFQVVVASDIASLRKTVTDQPVDLLLLCHTLTAEERQTTLAMAASVRPAMKRLVLVTNAQEVGEEEIQGDTIHMFAGAEGLIAATRKLLDRNVEL